MNEMELGLIGSGANIEIIMALDPSYDAENRVCEAIVKHRGKILAEEVNEHRTLITAFPTDEDAETCALAVQEIAGCDARPETRRQLVVG